MTTVRCGRCGRPIVWARTPTGKRMPLDPDPCDDGNVAAYRDGLDRVQARVLTKDEEPKSYERRRMPHFATCGAVAPRPVQQDDGTYSISAARDKRRRTVHTRG